MCRLCKGIPKGVLLISENLTGMKEIIGYSDSKNTKPVFPKTQNATCLAKEPN